MSKPTAMTVHNTNKLPVIPIQDLLPTQGNLKDLDETNYGKLKNNIERRGFIDPVAVWVDTKTELKYILNGHQRQRVLTKEGWNNPIPYFTVPAQSLQEAAAIVLELTSQYGKITQEGLDEHIAKYELPEAEIYEATHFDALIVYEDAPEPEIEEDEAPEVSSEPPVSELGKIYQLGKHRVMCGDSTDKASVELLMDGAKADMVFTDPPYGMNLDTDYTKMGDGGRKHDAVIADDVQFDPKPILDMFSYCKDIFLWGADYYVELLGRIYPELGSWIIWDKYSDEDRKGLLDGRFGSTFETCWSKTPHKREIARVLVTTNYTARGDETRIHPTQKPVELAIWFFKRWGKDKQIIVDVFLGSGSTLIACEQTDRICYGMELDPKYVDVIRKRYAKFIQPDNELPEHWQELTPEIAR